MVDLIDELKQDLRRQKLEEIVIGNGGKIIAFAVLIVVFTSAIYFYNQQKLKASIETGMKYFAAVDKPKTAEAKIAALEDFSKDAKGSYKPLAELRQADELILANKNQEAASILESVSKNFKYDQALREIAELKLVNIKITLNAPQEEIIKRLDAISTDKSAFKFSALELKANYLLQSGNKTEADKILQELAENKDVPQNIASRVKQQLGISDKTSIQ